VNWIRIIVFFVAMQTASHAAMYVAAPKWQVTVVNDKGEPMVGCQVDQTWSYYFGSGSTNAWTNAVTDSSGRVIFPERRVSVGRGKVMAGRITGALNVHSSYGPFSSIYVSKAGHDGVSVWRNPKLPVSNGVFQSTVMLKLKERPAALTEAVRAGNLEKLKSELKKDPYYAANLDQGVKLLNDVVRSPNANGSNAIEMVKAVLTYLRAEDSTTVHWVDSQDNDHTNALCRSILLRKFDVTECLLSLGALPSPSWETWGNPSALHLAIRSGNVSIVKALLAKGAYLQTRDADGKTPLDWAKQDRNQEIIRLLETAK
jgi:hypothetical protein